MRYFVKLDGFIYSVCFTFADAFDALLQLEASLGADGWYITTQENA